MRALSSEANFRDHVLTLFHQLPAQQQLVAQYMLDHLDEIPFLTVPNLAKKCSASEATVVRLSKSLGFVGFSGLKAVLAKLVQGKVAAGNGLPESMKLAAEADTLNLVAQLELDNIQAVAADLCRTTFYQAAAKLFEADHIYTFGYGISSHLAELACYLFTQVGLRSTSFTTRFSSPLEQAVTLRAADVLFCFSFPPYSAHTLRLAEAAKQRGATTIGLSDQLNAPLAEHSAYLFRIRSNNKMFTNAIAGVTVFLNALTTEIALKHGKHAADAVAQIHRILEQDDNLIPAKSPPSQAD